MTNELDRLMGKEDSNKWMVWNEEWPTDPGYYWFYGRRHKQLEDEQGIFLTEVVAAGENLQHRLYSCHGMFLYKSDGAKGLWMKAILPPSPTERQITKILGEEIE